MVEAQRAPRIALAGLHNGIGVDQGCLQRILLHLLPSLLAAVIGSHVLQVDRGDLRGVFPTVAALHHTGNARAIVAVDAAEDAVGRYLARLPRRKALVDERLFGIDHTPGHEVLIAVIFRRGGHLDGPRDEEQPRSRQVAQLAAGLYDDIDARTPPTPRRG